MTDIRSVWGTGIPLLLWSACTHLPHYPSLTAPRFPLPMYRWCQHLAGLDFVPTLPVLATQLTSDAKEVVLAGLDTYRQQQRGVTVVQRLREAKAGDVSLM